PAGCVFLGAVKRLKDALEFLPSDPGPLIADAQNQPSAAAVALHTDRRLPRETGRVVEHVCERALDLGGIGPQRREVVGKEDIEAAGGLRNGADSLVQDLVDREPLAPRLQVAGLQPGQIEKVLDEARETCCL